MDATVAEPCKRVSGQSFCWNKPYLVQQPDGQKAVQSWKETPQTPPSGHERKLSVDAPVSVLVPVMLTCRPCATLPTRPIIPQIPSIKDGQDG